MRCLSNRFAFRDVAIVAKSDRILRPNVRNRILTWSTSHEDTSSISLNQQLDNLATLQPSTSPADNDEDHHSSLPSSSPRQPKWTLTKETRQRMSQARTGYKHTEETKKKIADSRKGSYHTPLTRTRMAQSKLGHSIDDETRARISQSLRETKRKLRIQRIDSNNNINDDGGNNGTNGTTINPIYGDTSMLTENMVREKAIVEMQVLRRELAGWMQEYEKRHKERPDLEQTSSTHPNVYAKFVRYVALREYVRM
jgi:ribosomal protein L20